MLKITGKTYQWWHIEHLWDEMNDKGIVPISSSYRALIDVYSKGGRREVALVWLGRMSKQGIEPDEVTMGTVIQMYKKGGQFHEAEDFFRRWFVECLSSHTYNMLIDNNGKARELQEASATLLQMLKEGITPTTFIYNPVIHRNGKNGQSKEVDMLMQKMEELVAGAHFRMMKDACLKPDLVSYRTLPYAYPIRRMVHEAKELLCEMDERDLVIDEYTQSALLRMYIEAGMLKKSCVVQPILMHMESVVIILRLRVFLCCQEQRRQTVLEYNAIIKAYGKTNNYNKACRIFDSMEGQGISPDKCSYSSIIQILAGADFPYRALPYLRKLEMAEGLYREMIQCNILPDVVVYGVLINACGDAGSVQEAHGYSVYLREAEETYRMLQLSELGPDVFSSHCMIDLYSERSMVEQAEQIFARVKHKGDANEFTYAMMLIANQMRELGLLADQLSYNNPGNVLMKYGVSKHAVAEVEVLAKKDAQSGA
ncbi:hypothetical protein ACJRO7_016842 [Eucalyptus globulus]|uniref:Pentacotripeptide-repeat region of PRORP domain-containing protein n=1 Tax=Eucalyptus globulus TaxID=34317 RepID=A0ABD3KN51_EUCGL